MKTSTNLIYRHISPKQKTERIESTDLDAKYVLKRLVQIDSLDVIDILDNTGNMKAIRDWPKSWRTSISGLDVQDMMNGDTESVIKKIKWPDKLKNLELLGRHVNIKAWGEEAQVSDEPIHKDTNRGYQCK